MQYVVWKDEASNLFKWTLYTDNNRKICESVEKYYNRDDAHEAVATVKRTTDVPVADR